MIVVTGSSGFIGSALCSRLESVFDILKVDFHGDAIDPYVFSRNLKNLKYSDEIKMIIHLGAHSSTTGCSLRDLYTDNYLYSVDLAQYCLKNNIRMIYASSAATYGNSILTFSDKLIDINNLTPLNLYGESKHWFDLYLNNNGYFGSTNLFTGLKYFNVFGPNEYHKGPMKSFVLKSFEKLRDGKLIEIFNTNRNMSARDFIYIKDAVDMTIFAIINNISGIFNIGTGVSTTWKDLAIYVFNAYHGKDKCSFEYKSIDMPEEIKKGYQYYTRANIENIRKAGYKKQITHIEDAVKDYIDNYLKVDDYIDCNLKQGYRRI